MNNYKESRTGKKVLKEYTRKPNTRWFTKVSEYEVIPHVRVVHNIPWTHPIKREQAGLCGTTKIRYNLDSDLWELWQNPYGVY